MAAGSVSIKDRMAMLQKPADNNTKKEDVSPPTPVATPTNSKPTQPVKSKSGRFTRRLSMERIASGLKELRRGSTATEETVDESVDNELVNIRMENMPSTFDHEKTTTPRALTEGEVESLRMMLMNKLHMCGESYVEDAEDLLDYAMEMIEEGQTVGCVTDEVNIFQILSVSSNQCIYTSSLTIITCSAHMCSPTSTALEHGNGSLSS